MSQPDPEQPGEHDERPASEPERSPYAVPRAPLAEPRRRTPLPAPAPLKGLFFGLLTDIGGTLCSGLVLGVVYATVAAASGDSAEQIQAALEQDDPGSWLYLFSVALGLLFSVLGGYVCARRARRMEYRIGIVQAVLSSLMGAWLASSDKPAVLGTQIVLYGLSVLAIMVGIHFGAVKNHAERQEASDR